MRVAPISKKQKEKKKKNPKLFFIFQVGKDQQALLLLVYTGMLVGGRLAGNSQQSHKGAHHELSQLF